MLRGEIESVAFSNALGESVQDEQKTNPYTYRDFAKIRKWKKRKGRSIRSSLFESGSPSWARTNDLRINSPSLYRLSYRGMKKFLRTLSCGKLSGSPSWARTNDLRINSPSLYRLSYRGIRKHEYYRASRRFASLFVKYF